MAFSKKSSLEAMLQGLNDTTDATSSYSEQDIQNNIGSAVLAYFGPLVFIPIFAAKESPYARFHANQGLVLLLSYIAYNITQIALRSILYVLLWKYAHGHYSIFCALLNLVWLGFTALTILGIIHAARGQAKELPIIGKIHILR